jgi:hypothetical protein
MWTTTLLRKVGAAGMTLAYITTMCAVVAPAPLNAQCTTVRSVCCFNAGLSACGTSASCYYFIDTRSVDVLGAAWQSVCYGVCVFGEPPQSCAICLQTKFFVAITLCDGFEYIAETYLCCRDSGCCPEIHP